MKINFFVKEGLKGTFFAVFNSSVFFMAAFQLFGCEFNWFTSKLVYFGIFILPLLIVLYYTFKMMLSLKEKVLHHLLFCLVLGPNIMIVPTMVMWFLIGPDLMQCLPK